MKIAELFVNLGVKGADTSKRALTGVRDGLQDVASMGIETKAIILAVVYGLEQMMSQSAQMGTALTNFTALTGMSGKSLQQWQYAARQAGISGDELTGSLKGVQNSMTNMLLGKGAPEGMAMMANKVGFDPARARDTLYVMGQLQKFAQSVPQDVGNQMLKSFGLSEGTIAAMRRNMFRADIFAKAPTYSDRESGSLDKANIAWSNIGQKIQMAFGHFNAKHGGQLVNDITKIIDPVLKLAEALVKLSEAFHVFELIGKGASKLASFFTQSAAGANQLAGAVNDPKKRSEMVDAFKWLFTQAIPGSVSGAPAALHDLINKVVPPAPAIPQSDKRDAEHIKFEQQVHIHGDGHDAKAIGTTAAQETKRAANQLSSRSRKN